MELTRLRPNSFWVERKGASPKPVLIRGTSSSRRKFSKVKALASSSRTTLVLQGDPGASILTIKRKRKGVWSQGEGETLAQKKGRKPYERSVRREKPRNPRKKRGAQQTLVEGQEKSDERVKALTMCATNLGGKGTHG